MKIAMMILTVLSLEGYASAYFRPDESSKLQDLANSPEKMAYANYLLNSELPSVLQKFMLRLHDEVSGIQCDGDGDPYRAESIAKSGHCVITTSSGKVCQTYLVKSGCQSFLAVRWQLSCGNDFVYASRSSQAIAYNRKVFPQELCSNDPPQAPNIWCLDHPFACQ